MEFGSVKFWRRVIVGTIFGVIALLLLLTVVFGVRTLRLSRQLKELRAPLSDSSAVESDGNAAQAVYPITSPPSSDASTVVPMEDEAESNGPVDTVLPADLPPYVELFPELYVEATPKAKADKQEVVYLTFDDGPTEGNTRKLLDILDKYNAKATFFVTGQFGTKESRAKLYQEILDRGHTLGLHTYSHNYLDIYSSVEDYLADLEKIFNEVYEATGQKTSLIRFPGGSVNGYNDGIYKQLVAEVTRRGFTYADWRVSADDAVGTPDVGEIVDRVVEGSEKYTKSIVLCHDTEQQKATTKAIPDIIKILSGEGYQFRALDDTVRPYHFNYIDAQ